MSRIYPHCQCTLKTDEGSRNWCMGFNEPGARRCPYGCTQHFICRPTDLGEPLVPDVASTRWSCIQICVSSFINAEAQHSLLDLRHSIASIFSKVSCLVPRRLMWTST